MVHGVIIAGPAQPADPVAYADAVGEIARRLGWPVLADGLSPLRNHASRVPGLVTAYAGILRNAAQAERLKPERVLCLDEPLSALDDDTRAEMHALLNSVHQQTRATILHVTHHVADAQKLATTLLVLKKGQVMEEPVAPL